MFHVEHIEVDCEAYTKCFTWNIGRESLMTGGMFHVECFGRLVCGHSSDEADKFAGP